jgi:hypothetical protein
MATTTNYSWTTPDDTDLVKDGAAAIRTLGSSVDTTVKALNPGTTAGDIDYYTAGTTKARIAIGTAGQVLAVNSGATAPEWITFASGGMTLLSTTTLSGGSTSISVSPSGYVDLYVLVIGIDNATANHLPAFRPNGDNTGANYVGYWAHVKQHTSLTQNYQQSGTNGIGLYAVGGMGYKTGNTSNVSQFTIHNPNGTNRKLIRGSTAFYGNDDSTYWANFDINYLAGAAISSIEFTTQGTGTFTAGTVYVYGVK